MTAGASWGTLVAMNTQRTSIIREIGLFLLLTALLEAGLVGVVLAEDVSMTAIDDASALGQAALFGQAFAPGIAGLAARLICTGSVRGLGLGRGRDRRLTALAYLVPIAYTLVAYALLFAVGAGELDPASLAKHGPIADAPAGVGALAAAALALTLGMVPLTILALGEEIGWRGLMTRRLAEVMPLPRVVLWTGLAWSAFHLPLLLLVPGAVEGAPKAYAIALFTVGLLAISYPMAWLTIRTGSIWPATVMHAAMNAALYMVAEPLTKRTGEATDWLARDTGALLVLATVAAAAAWWSRTSGRGPRLRTAVATTACLAVVAGAVAVSPAAAKPGFGFTTAKFRIEVKGVQTTAWRADRPLGSAACDVGWRGEGTEVVRFASKPVVAKATAYKSYDPLFSVGKRHGAGLEMPARVTRRSDFKEFANECTDGDGKEGVTPPAPDCGRRKVTIDAEVKFERGRLLVDRSRDPFVPLPPYRNCKVWGTAYPALLWRDGGNAIGKSLSARRLFGGPKVRTITVGRRFDHKSAELWHETTLKYTVTLTRIGKVRSH
jgi:membrane protease YdiL (CAAX protease family)